MAEFEFLLCSRGFARPRQFVLHCDHRPDGPALESLLCTRFGPGPRFVAGRRLDSLPRFAPGLAPVITDLPVHPVAAGPQALRLYVLEGPDAGASIKLLPGIHPVGRCDPLWLQDPALARVQARVHVDHRDLRLYLEPGCPVHALARVQRLADGSLRLRRGSLLRMGQTVLRVDDPLRELGAGDARWPVPPPQPPTRPATQRVLALLATALIPLLIGGLLLAITGSRLFLLVSGCTAVLAMFPLAAAWRQRGVYRRELREHSERWADVRRRVAPPLGTVIAAADDEAAGVQSTGATALAWGTGSWSPLASTRGVLRFPSRSLVRPTPVFALAPTGAWQLVCEAPQAGYPVLCAMLARFLPEVCRGERTLLVDPKLDQLPAALLLLPNVRLARSPGSIHGAPGVNCSSIGTGGIGNNRVGEHRAAVIQLVAGTARPVPGALVLGLGPRAAQDATGWVNVHTMEAHLDDPQACLETLDLLDPGRFARVVERQLALVRHRMPAASSPTRDRVLHAVLGMDEHGREVPLDLGHDGPHILLAGTTGSGKSEALRRIVIELAENHPPQHLALALLDFKGGAGLGVFATLPHTQLFCSDLEGARAERMLLQLECEILRRERVLREAGCADVTEHRRAPRARQLPRLVVVVDEFRVLLDDLPDAAARMDRIATVGRALGIHLLLATQKPAGTLSGQLRANINTVIALRVREPGESSELVGTPAAARLQLPGQAVLRSSTRPALEFRFELPAPGPPSGYLAERHRLGFAEHAHSPVAERSTGERQPLESRMARVRQRWGEQPPLQNPFAPDLPTSATMPAPGVPRRGQVACGLLDDVPSGRLRPLHLFDAAAPALLASGLPGAGTEHLARQLLTVPRRLLYLDASAPDCGPADGSRLVFDGRDAYRFTELLDYLATATDLDDVLVVVRNVSGLASSLPASLFARLDEVLGAAIRSAPASGLHLVIIGDRDLSLLGSAQLCTRRWYFPLEAPQGLAMQWPKLPPVGAIVGRGVQLEPDGTPRTIQLTRFAADGSPPAERPRPPLEAAPGAWLLGRRGLSGVPENFSPGRIGFVLAARPEVRCELASQLVRRWNLHLCTGLPTEDATGALGLLLHQAPTPQLAARLNELVAGGRRLVVFTAPSARLAYEFSLPGMMLDERDVVVVEALHPHDMQPVNWPPLAREGQSEQREWRAVKLVDGQPRMVRIARDGV